MYKPVDLISISIVSDVDNKKYRILIKEANFNKLKVGEIKKNLQNVTGLVPEGKICNAMLRYATLHPHCKCV